MSWIALIALTACTPTEEEPLGPHPHPVVHLEDNGIGPRPGSIATRPWPGKAISHASTIVPPPSDALVVEDCSPGATRRHRTPVPKPSPRPAPAGFGRGGGAAKTESAPAKPSPPPPPAEPPPESEAEPMPMEDLDDAAEADAVEGAKTRVNADWGADIYLSNDDSMSLASAQRLLWAVDQGASFSAAEVRPHELLNYFSFDTQPVQGDRMFSVLGGAERSGDRLSLALAVQGAKPARQPLDLSLVIDTSGSMRSEGRMDYVKRGLKQMTGQLKDGDRIDLTLFHSRVCTPVKNFVVGRDDLSVLTGAIGAMQPGGSTDLDGGLREAYAIQTARDDAQVHDRNRRIVLLTDAFLNSGNVDEDLVSEIGRRFDEDGIRVTGIGVGRSFNDTMLDKITEKGKGAYVYLGSEAVVDRVFGAGFDALVQTIAHDVHFQLDLPDSLAMERFYGEEASTRKEDVQPIHYYAGTSQVFLQDLLVDPTTLKGTDPIVLTVEYRDARTGEPETERFDTTVGALLEGDTRNLHKAQALMAWTDVLAAHAMGDESCSTREAFGEAAASLPDDAEIAYVSGLTEKLCAGGVGSRPVKFRVKVDADVMPHTVELKCRDGYYRERARVSASTQIATFSDVPPGACHLVTKGRNFQTATVDVPAVSADIRCLIRDFKMDCH